MTTIGGNASTDRELEGEVRLPVPLTGNGTHSHAALWRHPPRVGKRADAPVAHEHADAGDRPAEEHQIRRAFAIRRQAAGPGLRGLQPA